MPFMFACHLMIKSTRLDPMCVFWSEVVSRWRWTRRTLPDEPERRAIAREKSKWIAARTGSVSCNTMNGFT
jgi:hypothetical protein